jgi:hypothetical protein
MVAPSASPDAEWGSCRFCGVAVPAGAATCGICGAEHPLSSAEMAQAPRRVRRWVGLTRAFRVLVVVTVVLGLTYAIASAVLSGPPSLVDDPLTTAGTYTIGPGNFTVISGEITAGDYVTGNFTAVHPVGVDVVLAVYNASDWPLFVGGQDPAPLYNLTPTYHGQLVYSPVVTDNYFFVFTNPYPLSSHLTIGVYIATLYNANVANDGFA